jgi:hypothetical protein
VRRPESKRLLGRSKSESNISERDKMRWNGLDRDQWRALVNTVMTFGLHEIL